MNILTAAVKTSDGVIHILPRPNRHADIVHVLRKAEEHKSTIIIAKGKQGFLADDGNFYDRKSAAKIAVNSGQIKRLEYPPTLFTEDLW